MYKELLEVRKRQSHNGKTARRWIGKETSQKKYKIDAKFMCNVGEDFRKRELSYITGRIIHC